MWPNKKKKRGINVAPGESLEIGFATSWRKDKDEVVIMTEDGPIVLDGTNELFIEIVGDNIDPIKLQLIPDFKKRTINFVEVIDPNAKKRFEEGEGPTFKFTGSDVRRIAISDYLKKRDRQIERLEKIVKKSRMMTYIFIPIFIILFFWNLYIFMINDNVFRYTNLIAMLILLYVTYYILNSHRRIYKDYLEFKEQRDRSFGIVKEK